MKAGIGMVMICLGLWGTTLLPAQDARKRTVEHYRSLIRDVMDKQKIAGVGAALIQDGAVVWKEGFGYADQEGRVPYTPQTTQPIGSVTKTITAVALMQLQDKGLLHIDQPLLAYLPEFRVHSRGVDLRRITVRTLLTHTSGLPNDIFLNAGDSSETFTKVLSYLPRETLCYAPGLIYHYSNIGMDLLGLAIASAGKTDYPQYLKKNIFQPLGMNHTGFMGVDKLGDVSRSYDGEGKPVPPPWIRSVPAGGAYSSVDDLCLLAQDLIASYHGKEGGILKPEAVREMFREQKEATRIAFTKTALGWDLFSKPSDFIVFHFGSDNVNNAALLIHPRTRSALVLLANSVGARALNGEVSTRFWRALGFGDLDQVVRYDAQARKTKVIPLSGEMVRRHEGTYGHSKEVFDLRHEGGSLMLRYGGTTLRLQPVDDDTFIPGMVDEKGGIKDLPGNRIVFTDIRPYHILSWETEDRQREPLAYRLEPQVIRGRWQQALGRYRVQGPPMKGPETFSEMELSCFENRLLKLKVFYTSGAYEYILRIVNDDELAICGFDVIVGGDTLRFQGEGADVSLQLYGLTLKKVSPQPAAL